MERKSAPAGVEVVSEELGIVRLKFANYDDIDKHKDVTRKGAFQHGAPVLVSGYNHSSWGGQPPVGKGYLITDGDAAYAEVKFWLDMESGRETFRAVKNAGDLQQWSYGLDVEESERDQVEGKSVRVLKRVKVHEVSPVLVGAGNGTATLSVKASDEGKKPKDDEDDKEKDNKKPKDDKDTDDKDSKKPKDDEDKDSKKPKDDEDKEKDKEDEEGEKKPGNGKSGIPGNMKMFDQCVAVLTTTKALADRAEEIVTLRKAEGKAGLSKDTASIIALIADQNDRLKAAIAACATSESKMELGDDELAKIMFNLSDMEA